MKTELVRDVWMGNETANQATGQYCNSHANLVLNIPSISKPGGSMYGWDPNSSVAPTTKPLNIKENLFKEFAPEIPNMGQVKYPACFRGDGGPQSLNPFFIRNRPHPNKVRHIKGLNDAPICTVFNPRHREGAAATDAKNPAVGGLGAEEMAAVLPNKVLVQVALGSLGGSEKAIPGIGMIKLQPVWLTKLRELTMNAGLQQMKQHMPIFRTKSADDARPGTNTRTSRASQRKAENDFVRRTVSQSGERTFSAGAPGPVEGSRVSKSQEGVRLPDINDNGMQTMGRRIPIENKTNYLPAREQTMSFPDGETLVFHLLASLLDTEKVEDIQQWLATSPEQEKECVLEVIRRMATHNAEFRHGVEQVITGNYQGSMLQHPESLDIEGINAFNAERKLAVEQQRQKKEETIRNYSPPLLKDMMEQNVQRDIENGSRQSQRARDEATASVYNLLSNSATKDDNEIEEIRNKIASRSSSRGVFGRQKPHVRINSRIDE